MKYLLILLTLLFFFPINQALAAGYTQELTASIMGSVIGMEPKDFADSLWMHIPIPSSAAYGKVIKYNPTTGFWTAQQDSVNDVSSFLTKSSLADSLKSSKWIIPIYPMYEDTTFAAASNNDITILPETKYSIASSDTTSYFVVYGDVSAGSDTALIEINFNPPAFKPDSLVVWVSNDSSLTVDGFWIILRKSSGIAAESDSISFNVATDSVIKGFKRLSFSLASLSINIHNAWSLIIIPRCSTALGTKQRITNPYLKKG